MILLRTSSIVAAIVVALTFMAARPSSASLVYSFETSTPANFSVVYTSDEPINTVVTVADPTCPTVAIFCSSASFIPAGFQLAPGFTDTSIYDAVSYNYPEILNTGGEEVFFFPADAFTTPGVYLNGGGASLTVADVSAAPEPVTWLLLVTGLGLVGWVTRRRKGSDALQGGVRIAGAGSGR